MGFLFYLSVLIGVFGPVPNQNDFRNLEQTRATTVLGANGETLGRFYSINRNYVTFNQMPIHLIDALVCTEDQRFYEHGGIDVRGLMRALIKTVALNKDAGGGSTISQQLVKNVFGRNGSGISSSIYITKLKEMIGARRLERLYEKDKILELYLNTVPFGENVYGIDAAAERYFSKKTIELNINESAILIGMLKANTTYNPRANPKRSEERRNVVLSLLTQAEKISVETVDSIKNKPFKINYNRVDASEIPPHYLIEIGEEAKRLLDGKFKRNGDPYKLKDDGLLIESSIHPQLQAYAEASMKEHLIWLQQKLENNWGQKRPWGRNPSLLEKAKVNSARYRNMKSNGKSQSEIDRAFNKKTPTELYYPRHIANYECRPIDSLKHAFFQLRSGFIATENKTGNILAWVGSPNHRHFQYDYVKSKRQVASTFKPIVYAAALEAGFQPCDFFRNEKIVYSDYDDWSPDNFNSKYGGRYSMKGALANSVNVVAVKLLYEAKRENVIEMAQRLGIKSEIPGFPSIALGVADISLQEMVRAYTVFANQGHLNEMRLITKITDRNGQILYERKATEGEEVLDKDYALMMREMLRGAVENGTGKSLKSTYKLEQELAGKTGTAQKQSDGWFIGFSPNITAGVWVGGDNPSVRFTNGTYGQGAKMALPIFALFMQKLEADTSLKSFKTMHFEPLESELLEELDCADFRSESDLEKFIDVFRSKELSDEKIHKRNRRRKVLKKVFGK